MIKTLAMTMTAVLCLGLTGARAAEPQSYEDCVLDNLRGTGSDLAAAIIKKACSDKAGAARVAAERREREIMMMCIYDRLSYGARERLVSDMRRAAGNEAVQGRIGTMILRTAMECDLDVNEIRASGDTHAWFWRFGEDFGVYFLLRWIAEGGLAS